MMGMLVILIGADLESAAQKQVADRRDSKKTNSQRAAVDASLQKLADL